MRLLTCKFTSIIADCLEVYLTALGCHKFEIDINEVFGLDFTTENLSDWLTEKPAGVTDWLRLPYPTMYIEYKNAYNVQSKGRVGFLLEEVDNMLYVKPLLSDKTRIGAMGYRVAIRLDGKMTESDFPSAVYYQQWLCMPWNTSERFDFRITGNTEWNDPNHATAIVSLIPMILESLLYINAKGVGTTLNHGKVKLKNKYMKALSNCTYKTLRIIKKGDDEEIINKNKRVNVPFIQRHSREHTVRGHMAVYTKERPLFGNPKNVGPIWISPHVRNKGTVGRIIKDYTVE